MCLMKLEALPVLQEIAFCPHGNVLSVPHTDLPFLRCSSGSAAFPCNCVHHSRGTVRGG